MTIFEQEMTTIEQGSFDIDYDLSQAQRENSQRLVFDELGQSGDLDPDKINIVLTGSNGPLANVVRSHEAEVLPTVPEIMGPYEDASMFMVVLMALHEGEPKEFEPGHVFRLHVADQSRPETAVGLPTFDDVLKHGLATEEQLLDFYQVGSLAELGSSYINVETNIALVNGMDAVRNPYSALGYKAIFELVDFMNEDGLSIVDSKIRGVVAYQNPEAMQSLVRFGIRPTPLIGDPTLRVSDEDKIARDGDDPYYYPLTVEGVPYSKLQGEDPEHNRRIFTDEEYAKQVSRVAGRVAATPLNIIYIG
jgi:hypothetical protein